MGFWQVEKAKSGSSFSGSPPNFWDNPFDIVKHFCSYISHHITFYSHHGKYVVTLIPWFVVGWIHHSWRTPFHSSLIPGKYVNIPCLLFEYNNIIISHNSSSSAQTCSTFQCPYNNHCKFRDVLSHEHSTSSRRGHTNENEPAAVGTSFADPYLEQCAVWGLDLAGYFEAGNDVGVPQ